MTVVSQERLARTGGNLGSNQGQCFFTRVRISSVTTPRSALYEQADVLKLELGELI